MTHQSLAKIALDLRTGQSTATALAEAASTRYSASEPTLKAYKYWAGPQAVRQAKAVDVFFGSGYDLGPLMGIPLSIKDLYGVPNMPVFAGTDTAFDDRWQAPGPLVQSVISQLGIVMGKTHTVEFAFGGIGTNMHWGAPVNPWSGTGAPRAPGGSSSGAGVSLVQGSALVAMGTDTAGSVRVPASFTGQCGLKTTLGRWSTQGIVPLSTSQDSPGVLCRSVEDLSYVFSAFDGKHSGTIAPLDLSGLRIGVVRNVVWDEIDPTIAANTTAALASMERKGAIVSDLTLPGIETVLEIFRQGGLQASGLRRFMDANFPDRIARLDPRVQARVQAADQISSVEYLRRRDVAVSAGQAAVSVFEQFDVLVTPTVPITAPVLAEMDDGEAYRRANMLALRNTAFVNLFGWCALTLPSGLDGYGIPSGLQMIAPPMQERRLLAAAMAAEAAMGRGPDLLGLPPL